MQPPALKKCVGGQAEEQRHGCGPGATLVTTNLAVSMFPQMLPVPSGLCPTCARDPLASTGPQSIAGRCRRRGGARNLQLAQIEKAEISLYVLYTSNWPASRRARP